MDWAEDLGRFIQGLIWFALFAMVAIPVLVVVLVLVWLL